MALDTTISFALLIAASSICFAFLSYKRNNKKDTVKEIEGRLKLEIKIDQLFIMINSIASDMKDMNKREQRLSERMTKVEESAKSAHHRLDGHLKMNKKDCQCDSE